MVSSSAYETKFKVKTFGTLFLQLYFKRPQTVLNLYNLHSLPSYCAERNCVNSSQRNQPAGYKSATRTVNHKSDLLSCEISLPVYVLIWQMNCSSLSVGFRLAISEKPYFGMYVYHRPTLEAVVGKKEMKTHKM